MIGPAGFMKAPKAQEPVAPRARWDVSSFSRSGVAHWWVDSIFNATYVRSHCGQIEARRNLQGLTHELARCKVCEKAMRSNAKSEPTSAALSREVGSTDGLGGTVPPTPTFGQGEKK